MTFQPTGKKNTLSKPMQKELRKRHLKVIKKLKKAKRRRKGNLPKGTIKTKVVIKPNSIKK